MRSRRHAYRLAVYLLKHGHPLPVDLQATLIEFGYSPKELERIHGQ